MNNQILVHSLLAFNAILASVLGGVILYKGMSRQCNAQVSSGVGLLAFSVIYWLFAHDLSWWSAGLLPSVFAIAMLKQDAILTRISARCDSAIDRINRAELVPIKVSSDNR